MRKLLLLVTLLAPIDAYAVCHRFAHSLPRAGISTIRQPQFIVCDLETQLPTVDVAEGDEAYTKDSDKLLKRTATAWVEVGAGGGGAPTTATYHTQTPDATLSAEQAWSLLGTGLVLNTTGTGVASIYAGTSCTNQFPRSLSASGAATCASVATTDIVNDAVTFAKMQGISELTVIGRVSTGVGDPEELNTTQLTSMIDIFTSVDAGTVPGSGGGTTNFLRADGTWSPPPGGGSGLTHPQVMTRSVVGF